jgi:hypothetical protein
MKCRGLARCAVAALAEAQRATKRPKAKTDRIMFAPFTGYAVPAIVATLPDNKTNV